ncbi:plasmid mobilization protein [Persicobacter psychrovividus]|uniref:Plasmid mobilization relaxosome protein MobC n=1 Tax=Persicobacter psychrovividus TaxID=387638 RepID=A0ABM7VM41_9BACT|nr:hypothetical protein PEPS_42550 [Persicobacter psychrovividus]
MPRTKTINNKERRVEVSFSPEEFTRLEDYAKQGKCKKQDILRALVMEEGALKIANHSETIALARELVSIGNNLNQVARKLNMNEFYAPEGEALKTVRSELIELLCEIRKHFKLS